MRRGCRCWRSGAPRPLIQVGTLVAEDQAVRPARQAKKAVSGGGGREGEGRNEVSHSFAQLRRSFPLFVVEVGMEILIRDARFWVALLLLIRSVLFYVVPAFPEQIWVAIDTFVGVVLGILAGNNVVQTRRRQRRGPQVSSRPTEGHRRPGFLLSLGTCWVHPGVPQFCRGDP